MISDIEEIRADGKVITEGMDFDAMRRLGWTPCRVTTVRWRHDGRQVQLQHEAGLTIQRLPGRAALPALVRVSADQPGNRLCVIDADGQLRHQIDNVQSLDGRDEAGAFRWFEDPPSGGPEGFRVVFELARNGAMFLLDIDAVSGRVMTSRQMA